MWAQTYKSGQSYYREHATSRSLADCPAHGGSITCRIIDDQIRALVSGMELKRQWLEEALAIISLKDEADRINKEREEVTSKLKRMARAYIDGLIPEDEYVRQKKLLEMASESLIIPDCNAAEEAGKLILDLRRLWAEASPSEQRRLLLTMLDAIYIDARDKSIVAIKPKPAFRPIFQVASTKKDSKIHIITEPLGSSPKGSVVFLVETGESRTPRPEKDCPEYATGLAGYLFLPFELQPAESRRASRFFFRFPCRRQVSGTPTVGTRFAPVGVRSGGCAGFI